MSIQQTKPLVEVLQSLGEKLEFRKPSGLRHPLGAILTLACSAMLCGIRSYSAIAQWGKDYGQQIAKSLGFKKGKTPSAATLHRVFRAIDRQALEAGLGEWAEAMLAATGQGRFQGIALDGKTLRGSQKQGADLVHLLSAVGHGLGLTLAQRPVPSETNEITVITRTLKDLVLDGRVITVDALLTQKNIAREILNQGGDYLMIVKGNQEQLRTDIQDLFAHAEALPKISATVQTLDIGHGRIVKRQLTASSLLNDYLQWPGVQQVLRIDRDCTHKKSGKHTQETVYGITSFAAETAGPTMLLHLARQHWHIENKSHWVRDVTFDEDRSQVRCGNIPQVMAALRNTAIGLLRASGFSKIASTCRQMAANPWQALALLGIPIRE